MTDPLRALLQDLRAALSSSQPSAETRLRTSELPATSAHGQILIAVDMDGDRHILVPLAPGQRVRSGSEGASLKLVERALEDDESYGRFADLACTRRDLDDVFTALCADVIVAVASLPERPLKALNSVVAKWRALFRTNRTGLSSEQIIGLFGEIFVLSRLLAVDPGAIAWWTGPSGHRHDFSGQRIAIEVKSSTATTGRPVRIHGLNQLEAPPGCDLAVCWIRLEQVAEGGVALGELIVRSLAQCDDELELRRMLAQRGVDTAAGNLPTAHFRVLEECWYMVDDDFPRLTGSMLAHADIVWSVSDVHYTVDLAGGFPQALEETAVQNLLATLLGVE